MHSATTPRDSYDRVAHLYDVDMARNMAFDDVALYLDQSMRGGGAVLELGCGNGRILLALVERGIDAVGVDCSPKMLAELGRKARERGLRPRTCLMDARQLAFANSFATVLCPYSLITYMSAAGDRERMLAETFAVLAPGGNAIVDAFVPRATAMHQDFALDYRRSIGKASLRRSKRVMSIAPGVHRIERRYELTAGDGTVVERIDTIEEIRPLAPEDLVRELRVCGFEIEREWWDYGARPDRAGAQFYTVSARRPAASTR
ncbi:MAG: class I SAM-dependent methyltransferase [Betaproteobacteria bacterium]